MTQKIGLELDIAWDSDMTQFLASLPKPLTILNIIPEGPAGGNPCISFECTDINQAQAIFDIYGADDDITPYLFDIN